jgi:CHAD domain-containing protein
MAEGKWISGLQPDTPLVEAARHAVFVRLQVVRDCLPRAVAEADRDPEHVHQLRVGTRRADAALRLFRVCLPSRTYRAARRKLRRIRRAAGAARDWDVFLLGLKARDRKQPAAVRPGLDFLLGYAFGQRTAAQATLEAVGSEQGALFEEFRTDVVAAVRPPDDPELRTLLDLARPLLTGLRAMLEHLASGDLSDYAHLHQVRIAGKRLRYGMEVFADCFDPPFKEVVYPRIEEMQEILGRANDSHVAEERLSAVRQRLRQFWPEEWERLKKGIESLRRFHRRRLLQEREHFLAWWDAWRQDGSEALLNLLLPPVAIANHEPRQ